MLRHDETTKKKDVRIMKDKHLTTNQGVPVSDNQNSLTVGRRGLVVLQDVYLIEKLAHFDRARYSKFLGVSADMFREPFQHLMLSSLS
jgi:catalase